MHDAESTFSIGTEGELIFGVEARGVGAIADGGRGHDFSGGGVHDSHFAVADGEEPLMLLINSETGGAFAGSDGPSCQDLVCAGVDVDDFAEVLDVVIDGAFAVGDREFGFAGKLYGGDDLVSLVADDGGVFATAVEGQIGRASCRERV